MNDHEPTGTAGAGEGPSNRPREEAGRRLFSEFTEDQRRVTGNVNGLLLRIAQWGWSPRPADKGNAVFLPWTVAARDRTNQVVLIDGGRGSGKTTVFTTLLHAWSARWLGDSAPEHFAPREHTFVPLEILDLHPLPKAANLLLHIAGRFHRVVKVLEEMRGGPGLRASAPFHPSIGSELRASALWQKFIQAAAAGWEGNLEQRKGHLDPEDFAVELEIAERMRLDVPVSFYMFLDALTQEFQDYAGLGPRTPPLFVVPIDDADMNPQRAVQLIELLRTLWHPRVVFLLTGDSGIFRKTLSAHFLGVLRQPFRDVTTTAEDHRSVSQAADHNHLAEELYARVVPPSHRFELGALSAAERFSGARVPVGPRGAREELCEGNTLAELLEIPAAPADTLSPKTLADYFRVHPALCECLPDRLRPLQDLGHALRHLRDAHEDIAGVVNHLWKQRVTRSAFAPDLQAELFSIVHLLGDDARAGGARPASEAGGRRGIAVAGQALTWHRLDQDIVRKPLQRDWRLVFHRPFRYEAAVHGGRSGAPAEGTRLPRWVVATLMLATDIAADDPAGRFIGQSPTPSGLECVFTRVEFQSRELGGLVRFTWPLPEWESFLDFDLFERGWVSLLRARGAGSVEAIAAGFLRLVLDIAESRSLGVPPRAVAGSLPPPAPERGSPAPAELDGSSSSADGRGAEWREIAGRIARLANASTASRRDEANARWALSRAALLAAPEGGLSRVDAPLLLDAIRSAFGEAKEVPWDQIRQELRDERQRHLRFAVHALQQEEGHAGRRADGSVDDRVEALLAELDNLGSAWDAEIEGSRRAAGSTTLVDDLAKIPVLLHESYFAPRFAPKRTLDVGGYARGERAEALRGLHADDRARYGSLLWPFRGKIGGAATALRTLWRTAVSRTKRDDLDHDLVVSSTGLSVQDRISRTYAPIADARIGDGLSFELSHPGTAVKFDHNAGPTPDVLETIYRIAWDVAADESDASPEGNRSQALEPWWLAAGTRRTGCPKVIPWVAVDWPALYDWELIDEAWEPLSASAAAALVDHDADRGAVIDTLAFRWLRAARMVAESRAADDMRWSDKPADLAAEIALLQRDRSRPYRGRRWAAFAAFREALPLMAAPESGLSEGAARTILGAFPLTDEGRAKLRALRRERLVRAAAPEDQVDAVLASIDAERPAHPWVAAMSR